MKKIFFGLVALLTLTTISCSPSEEKTRLTYGSYIPQEHFNPVNKDLVCGYKLYYQDMVQKAVYNETMIVVVYPGDTSTCGCWNDFQYTIRKFINETNYKVYLLNYSEIPSSNEYGLIYFSDRPTFHIFANNQIILKVDYKDNKNIFQSSVKFKECIDQHVKAPIMYEVDDSKLAEVFNEGDSRIFYARSKCGDCNYVIPNVLVPYFNNKETDEKLYIYDAQKLRDDTSNPSAYVDFKDHYGLSEKYNSIYGYGEGFIPTFQYVENGIIKSQSVYFNDVVGKNPDGSYFIEDSYYTQDRVGNLDYLTKFTGTKILKGLKLNADDVYEIDTYIGFKQEKAAEYHNPLLQAFLDYIF